MSNTKQDRLASERVVLSAPMSYAGSAQRIWPSVARGGLLLKIATVPLAVCLVLTAWSAISCWYLIFGIWVVPFRLIRRSGRRRKMESLRHREAQKGA